MFPYLFICGLDDLSINVSGMLKSVSIIVLLSISSLMFVNICFFLQGDDGNPGYGSVGSKGAKVRHVD